MSAQLSTAVSDQLVNYALHAIQTYWKGDVFKHVAGSQLSAPGDDASPGQQLYGCGSTVQASFMHPHSCSVSSNFPLGHQLLMLCSHLQPIGCNIMRMLTAYRSLRLTCSLVCGCRHILDQVPMVSTAAQADTHPVALCIQQHGIAAITFMRTALPGVLPASCIADVCCL